ncbi:hypothetical protein NQT62_01055 [Limnobacter humi]|uniref:Fenitrothion hydrolase n=1 Tax=Limnobacter humi TaxID=1778671 RepID=A0ABT1WBY4_9BURK|nr:hypothetical protein [Limnobacter humi]MCQ8895022.1 hypothetical protein [Limnobacter humi]
MKAAAALLLLVPGVAFGHAFGEPVQLPMPYGLYIWGSVLALVLSFVLLAAGGGKSRLLNAQLALPWPVMQATSLERMHRCAALVWLAILVVCVLTGLLGTRDSMRNINMTTFWILYVLGGAYMAMLVGNWYTRQFPWQVLMLPHWKGPCHYPRWLGHWPATVLFVAMVSIELFLHNNPRQLAWMLLGYGLITCTGMALFGTRRWLQRGDPLAALFRVFAACAPLRRLPSQQGQIRWDLVMPFSQLKRLRLWHPAQAVFVFFLLSSTAFDGLRETKVYFNVFWQDPFGLLTLAFGEHPMKIYPVVRPWFFAWEFGLLLASPFFYLGLFWLFLRLGQSITGKAHAMSLMMRRHLPSLIPIAVVYHVTHYYTLLLSQGLKIRGLVSDPLGWGWNLFGTAITGRLPWLPDMANIWTSQVVLILVGHVAAVWLSHQEALRMEGSAGRAALNQLPMLVLMVVFTAVGLWVLAQPLQG